MASHPSLNKIQPDHLDRDALIYVRQSSFIQVRDNTASTMRQYDLVQRALSLGWSQERIQVIDQDQGHSGSSSIGRDGFQLLVAEVGLKHCGALLSLEVSRLARSCSDWYHLLEICALTETLVIDEEGIYDPGHYNDRLLLGFKGTMSEAELHWLRSRLEGGKRKKAEQGQLRFRPPVGLVFDPTGQLVLDPDEEVQHAVHPGYLTWAQFLYNQARLADNRPFRPEEHRGAVREGAALLQGLVLCGQCGRRMGVRYLDDGVTPLYACTRAHVDFAAPTCQTLRGDGIDATVAQTFLDAIQPAHLAVALATLDSLTAQARQIERQWHLRLERAQYEADLARRRFLAVEPENRLVARSLEREWNETLAEVGRLERDSTA